MWQEQRPNANPLAPIIRNSFPFRTPKRVRRMQSPQYRIPVCYVRCGSPINLKTRPRLQRLAAKPDLGWYCGRPSRRQPKLRCQHRPSDPIRQRVGDYEHWTRAIWPRSISHADVNDRNAPWVVPCEVNCDKRKNGDSKNKPTCFWNWTGHLIATNNLISATATTIATRARGPGSLGAWLACIFLHSLPLKSDSDSVRRVNRDVNLRNFR